MVQGQNEERSSATATSSRSERSSPICGNHRPRTWQAGRLLVHRVPPVSLRSSLLHPAIERADRSAGQAPSHGIVPPCSLCADSRRVADDVVVDPEIERTKHRIPVFLVGTAGVCRRERSDGRRRRAAVGGGGIHRSHPQMSRIIPSNVAAHGVLCVHSSGLSENQEPTVAPSSGRHQRCPFCSSETALEVPGRDAVGSRNRLLKWLGSLNPHFRLTWAMVLVRSGGARQVIVERPRVAPQ